MADQTSRFRPAGSSSSGSSQSRARCPASPARSWPSSARSSASTAASSAWSASSRACSSSSARRCARRSSSSPARLRLEDRTHGIQVFWRHARRFGVAEIQLLRGHAGLLPAGLSRLLLPGGHGPPGHHVGLTRLRHAGADGSLLGLLVSHVIFPGRTARACPPRYVTWLGSCTRVMDPCPRRHHGAGRSVARKRAGRALPLSRTLPSSSARLKTCRD
jgi:hypothetical protein